MLIQGASSRAADRRPGFTLVEVLVAVTVGAVVFAVLTAFSVREQRIFADAAANAALAGQLRDAASVLSIDIRAASPGSGDIRDARDTSLEVRATIASAVICDVTATAFVLPPSVPGPLSTASDLRTVRAGDTAWVLSPDDSVEAWQPYFVASLKRVHAGQCAPGGPVLDPGARVVPRTVVALPFLPPASTMIGRPIRVTRPVRYSLYRASNGDWYLGEREWNPANDRFDAIQPVSGPFLPAVSSGLRFTYLDTAGSSIQTPVADTRRIVAIRIGLRGQTPSIVRALGAAASRGVRNDSVVTAVLLRNAR